MPIRLGWQQRGGARAGAPSGDTIIYEPCENDNACGWQSSCAFTLQPGERRALSVGGRADRQI